MATSQSTTISAPVEYRELPGFFGYRVGDDGSVWTRWVKMPDPDGGSLRVLSGTWHPLSISRAQDGYLQATVRHTGTGKKKAARVHRLVLLAFVGECPPGMECRHLDGNRANNVRSNLCWGTRQANAEDRRRHGTLAAGVTNGRAKISDDDVRDIRRRHRAGETKAALARRFNLNWSTINRAVRGINWRHVTEGQ